MLVFVAFFFFFNKVSTYFTVALENTFVRICNSVSNNKSNHENNDNNKYVKKIIPRGDQVVGGPWPYLENKCVKKIIPHGDLEVGGPWPYLENVCV